MDILAALRRLLREMIRFDRSRIDTVRAFRNAVGVVAPLAVGAVTGHLLTGFAIGIGALNVAFCDWGGPYRLRTFRMLLASVFGALSVFVGSATANMEPVAVVLVAVWAFGGGIVLALGIEAGQVGMTGLILLLVFGGYPAPPDQAASQALLVLGGGLLQTLLSISAWATRQHGPERAVLGALFQNLAEQAREPADPNTAPPMTGVITTASTTLSGFGRDHSAAGEAFRALLDEAERIRLELVALNAIGSEGPVSAELHAARTSAADVLDAAHDVLAGRAPAVDTDPALRRIDDSIGSIRASTQSSEGAERLRGERILAHLEALAGQLRAVVELAAEGSASERAGTSRTGVSLRTTIRGSLDILRANLTINATYFRHALRLAVCLTVASFLARRLGVSRVYWVPMTAAIVLRPDFSTTFTRGVGRIVGTMLGLAVATGLAFTPFWNLPGRVLLIGLLAFAVRSLGPANFAASAVGVSALVVVLLSFAGVSPDTTVSVRALDTLLGGGVALLLYLLWPTWERTQTPTIVATMLETYRTYFDAVMAGYLNPREVQGDRLAATRLASRLARSNAETSLEHLRNEPVRSGERLDELDGLLASSHRFAQSAMTLESGLYREPKTSLPSAAERFVQDVDRTIDALAQTVRDPSSHLDGLPDLRADQNALVEVTAREETGIGPSTAGTLAAETERMTNSLNTMAHLLRQADGDRPTKSSG